MPHHAVPVVYKRRQFGFVVIDPQGQIEIAVIAGRLAREVPMDRWRELLATSTGEEFEDLPEARFARFAFFFEAGARLIHEFGGSWRNGGRSVDAPDTDQSQLVAGEAIPLEVVDEKLRPAQG